MPPPTPPNPAPYPPPSPTPAPTPPQVRCVALTSRARFAVTGSTDTTTQVWDLLAPPLQLPQHHLGKVRALAVAPDGETAASIGDDGQLMLWATRSGACLGTGTGHGARAAPQWLACVPAGDGGGARWLSGSADRRVAAWGLEVRARGPGWGLLGCRTARTAPRREMPCAREPCLRAPRRGSSSRRR
jgi:hypothetical protein